MLRIAHRGLPRRHPENTLPSFEAAIALGADGIELDVHATSDGVVVVHHDPGLGDGTEIRRTTWQALRGVSGAPSASMPTLDEVCRLVGTRAELFVEIKGAGIEDAVVDVLRGYSGTAAIHSFDHALITRLARRGVPNRLGILVEDAPDDPRSLLEQAGATDLWPERRAVSARLVRDVHAAGGRVIAWTVNDPEEAQRMAELGVDGLCTDDVSLLG
ncbi:MAG TPA: glycerophosphodiester phosphodiesterase [Gemmatimonadaceae bacterium]|nr:glycerophosphodiester phosphodiesterase [Gemmatimonadaceae bacterium]